MSAEAALTAPLALRVTPHGGLVLDGDSGGDRIPPAAADAIRAAFADGPGAGVLHLGAVEVATTLPPDLAFFREVGRRFMTSLCGTTDLAEARERVDVPCPRAELALLADGVPPLPGAEYVDGAMLEALWAAVLGACRAELRAYSGPVEKWLAGKSPAFSLVGRVCFHLAENRDDDARPFAFLATYTTRLSASGKPQHVPLGRALTEYAGDKRALLALLVPVEKAAARSPLLRQLVDAREVFHPLAWTALEAHRFLREVPLLEEAGVIVRVPDWWRARRRFAVSVTVGSKPPSTLGQDALLDFSARLALDGEAITAAELRRLLDGTEGLALVRGRWVEVDRDRLGALLEHFGSIERAVHEGGTTFAEGMRLLAGAPITDGSAVGGDDGGDDGGDASAAWSSVTAGPWLASVLAGLRTPESLTAPVVGAGLRASLRPYQRVGVAWLHLLQGLGLGACLADDMGLGKTLQVIALLVLLQERGSVKNTSEKSKGKSSIKATANARPTHLLVVPASLIGNWQSELERFAPSLRALVAHPSAMPAAELKRLPPERLEGVDLVITTYGSVQRLPWLLERRWDLVILDEAQAVKNPSAKQTRAVKSLTARSRIALTGTPVENRLGDLWSLYDFLNPGLLGSARQFTSFTRRIGGDYGPLRRLVRPYLLRRLKSDRSIIGDLPDKTEVNAWCSLSKKQAALYQQSVDELARKLATLEGIERRGVILSFLLRFKQICNHPSQWLGDGDYGSNESGKLLRLSELCEPIAARQEKVLVFTQFREMTSPLVRHLAGLFGREGLVLDGQTPIAERKRRVDRFQSDESVPYFVLSLKAGGTGLNLTAASHVVHFDRWWNPAVEDQATDRAYRIGQRRNVLVHKLVCRGTVEEKIDALITSKQSLSREVLGGGGEMLLTEMGDRELLDLVSLDIHRALDE